MENNKAQSKTGSGENLYSITEKVAHSRSILDMTAQYILNDILNGQEDRTPGDVLETVLFAVETARDEARAAETELRHYRPGRQASLT